MSLSYRPNRPADSSLEKTADALLLRSVATDGRGEYPFYQDRWLRQLQRREEAIATQGPQPRQGNERPGLLLEAVLAEAGLSDQQRRVVELVRGGATLREASRELGRPVSTVHRWLQIAIRRMRQALPEIMAGSHHEALWREVLREETALRVYQPERHCDPGQEACRRDGICRRRWYLYCEEC